MTEMGQHSSALERTRDLYLKVPYQAQHVDTERQPGRSPDGIPDDDFDPPWVGRAPDDADLLDR